MRKFRLRIPEQIIDVEFEEIDDNVDPIPPIFTPQPPVVVEPPIFTPQPPVVVEPPIFTPQPPAVPEIPPIIITPDEYMRLSDFEGDTTQQFLYALDTKDAWLRLEDKSTTVIGLPTDYKIKPKFNGWISNKSILTFESWEKSPTQLFDLSGCNHPIGLKGVTVATPPNRPLVTGFPDKEIFGWDRDSLDKGMFAYIDAEQGVSKERVTYGLTRFCYSSKNDENKIYVIADNVHHNGFNFTQAKNPYTGNLWMIWNNVSVHNPIIELPQSHYYSPTRFRVRGVLKDGVFTITSNNTFSQILTWHGYHHESNTVRSILLFGKYVFDINDSNLIDDKTIIVERPFNDQAIKTAPKTYISDVDINPSQLTNCGIVKTKDIDGSRKFNWIYTFDRDSNEDHIEADFNHNILIEGEYDAFIVYKGNALFSMPFSEDSKFGDGYWESGIYTISQGYGWSCYANEYSGNFSEVNIQGFYWQTGGSGITDGLSIEMVEDGSGNQTMKDCYFEKGFTPRNLIPTKRSNPKEVDDFIRMLRKKV